MVYSISLCLGTGQQNNELKEKVEEQHLERRMAMWKKIDEPGMSKNLIRLNDDYTYIISWWMEVLKVCWGLYFKVGTHHQSRIYFGLSMIAQFNTSWYCQCRAGAREYGACDPKYINSSLVFKICSTWMGHQMYHKLVELCWGCRFCARVSRWLGKWRMKNYAMFYLYFPTNLWMY